MSARLDEAIALYNSDKFEEAYALFYDMGVYQRNTEALFYLGMMNQFGEGVEENLEKALEYWRMAANLGHTESAYRMNEFVTSTRHTSK